MCLLEGCGHQIKIQPGHNARAKLLTAKRSHLLTRHAKEQRDRVPRIGAAEQLIKPSHELPHAIRAWTCGECGKGLPLLCKVWHEASVRRHFQDEHPHITPTAAYRKNNARMLRFVPVCPSEVSMLGSLKELRP